MQTRSILHQYEELLYPYGERREDYEIWNQNLNDRSMEFLDLLRGRYEGATNYFNYLMAYYLGKKVIPQVFRYTDLMYAPIRHAVNYLYEAFERINASPS